MQKTTMTLLALCAAISAMAMATAHYEGELLLKPGPDGRHMVLAAPYSYIDSQGHRWDVPMGAEIDGASIPQIFWSIIGGPFEGKYRNASVIHDWYCDVRTKPWHDVDRMFYEAMLTSGVGEAQAKTLYLAVVFGGPRWDEQTIHNSTLLAPSVRAPRQQLLTEENNSPERGPIRLTPPGAKERLRQMAEEVEEKNLSLDQIDALAEQDALNVQFETPPSK